MAAADSGKLPMRTIKDMAWCMERLISWVVGARSIISRILRNTSSEEFAYPYGHGFLRALGIRLANWILSLLCNR